METVVELTTVELCESPRVDMFACQLFTYRGNVIAIDLIGAGVPILVSVILLLRLALQTHWSVSWKRGVAFALLVTALATATAVEFTVWDALYGGLSINTRLLLYTVILPVGFIQFLATGRASFPRLSISMAYVVGTFGLTLSDLLRTFSGTLNVTPQIMGAGGPFGAIFTGPLFVVISYMLGFATYALVLRRRGIILTVSRTGALYRPRRNEPPRIPLL